MIIMKIFLAVSQKNKHKKSPTLYGPAVSHLAKKQTCVHQKMCTRMLTLGPVLSDDLGGGMGSEAQEVGDVCTLMAESHC